MNKINIHRTWNSIIFPEFEKAYFQKLIFFLNDEKKKFKIFPNENDIFNAFLYTSFNKLKVVIVGQDPYHKEGQANGLSFSISKDTKTPPSLKNILLEVSSDIGNKIKTKKDLIKWAEQGVLLLNTTLTVREKKPGSHKKKGWEIFTKNIIHNISKKKNGIIFLLWGKHAQKLKKNIDLKKHFILESSHPSPLSAYKGFFGCKHFSKCNKILINQDKTTINWGI